MITSLNIYGIKNAYSILQVSESELEETREKMAKLELELEKVISFKFARKKSKFEYYK